MNIKLLKENFAKTNGGYFEGWGTSLCWWAFRVGYSNTLCRKSADLFFSENGLNLNIMRYNIGGGDNPVHNHIKRSDSAVPGWLRHNEKSNEYIFDSEADKNQLAVLKSAYAAAGENAYVEVFSNSPPYFMTVSGCSSGSENAVDNNLKEECIDSFAEYLADVSCFIENVLGIRISSVSPMNEPDTDYWKMNSEKQEGCHYSPGKFQSDVICATRKAFDKNNLKHIIVAASDETSTERQINSYKLYTEEAKKSIGRISTHTYIEDRIKEFGELREKEGFNLWMSEVDGAGTAGENAGEMSAALWLSKKIISDINALSPSAWVLWLVMDYHKSTFGYGGNEDYCKYDRNSGYWGLGHCDHDNKDFILTQKYYAFGQFTRYIKRGMTLIHINEDSLGAYDKNNNKCIIVTVNTENRLKECCIDLSDFLVKTFSAEVITTCIIDNVYKQWNAEQRAVITDNIINGILYANSVTTFIVEDIYL